MQCLQKRIVILAGAPSGSKQGFFSRKTWQEIRPSTLRQRHRGGSKFFFYYFGENNGEWSSTGESERDRCVSHMALARFGVRQGRAPVRASERSISQRKPWFRPGGLPVVGSWQLPAAGLCADLTRNLRAAGTGRTAGFSVFFASLALFRSLL